eukprot:GILK01011003.1.p1 GENE.GILK01011003.1~~GILK01011003.1.p1  ORF type:complete len:492 (+),score=87.80 GILK01011003.1:68-1543(+)
MMVFVYILVAAALGLFAFMFKIYREAFVFPHSDCPSPEPDMLGTNVGLLQSNMHRFLDFLWELHVKYGTFSLAVPFASRSIFISDPVDVEHVLKTKFDTYQKGPIFKSLFDELLGDGIFNVDGASWHMQRKTASMLFSARNFRDYMSKVFIEKVQATILPAYEATAASGSDIDVQRLFSTYTMHSICKIGFGVDIEGDQGGSVFAKAFDDAQLSIERRFFTPLWKVVPLFVASERRLRQCVATLDAFAYEIIDKRRKDTSVKEREDFLSLFICQRDDDGKEFSDRFLRDIVMNFLLAGRDTTSSALTWATYMLATYPHTQTKAQEEVDSCLKNGDLSYDTIKEMRFLGAIVDETIRLYPPVPRDGKHVMEDDVLPNGYKVSAGCMITYMPYVMGRMTSLWGEDALEFKPERWLAPGFVRPSPYKYSAFQGGPRICLGQNMAILQLKLTLAMILQKYTFSLSPGHPVVPQANITLRAKDGVFIRVQRRTNVM